MVSMSRSKTEPIARDIRQARTLPSKFYKDKNIFEESRERLFARSWQFVSDVDRMRQAAVQPITILPGFLDEPILLMSTGTGQFSCHANACTHRGNQLIAEPCSPQQLRCSYHGRCFDLKGNFVSAPGFEDATDFPNAKDNLPKVPWTQWANLLFAGVQPAFPFHELVEDIESRLSWMRMDKLEFAPQYCRDFEVDVNWLLYVENYLEGLHLPYVHPGLTSQLDLKKYRTEVYKYSSLQIGYAADSEPAIELAPESIDFGTRIGAYFYFLFPNLILNYYHWGLSLNLVEPISVDKTRIRYLAYLSIPESEFKPEWLDAIYQTEKEDQAIITQVSKGMKSRFYSNGRYSPRWEPAVHHFHRLIMEYLG